MKIDAIWLPHNLQKMLMDYKRIEEKALKTKDDELFELLSKQLEQLESKIKLEFDFMETDELDILKRIIDTTFTNKQDLKFFRYLNIA